MFSFCVKLCRSRGDFYDKEKLKNIFNHLSNETNDIYNWLDIISKSKIKPDLFWNDLGEQIIALNDSLDSRLDPAIENHKNIFKSRMNAFIENDPELLDVDDHFFRENFDLFQGCSPNMMEVLKSDEFYEDFIQCDSSKDLKSLIGDRFNFQLEPKYIDFIEEILEKRGAKLMMQNPLSDNKQSQIAI